jgi:hypothetical protein
MEYTVSHLQVTTQPNFDRRGNVSSRVQYSYFIGDHGPFVDTFKEGEDTAAAVMAAQQKRIEHLRAVGAFNEG